jgi:hypothetical protein
MDHAVYHWDSTPRIEITPHPPSDKAKNKD